MRGCGLWQQWRDEMDFHDQVWAVEGSLRQIAWAPILSRTTLGRSPELRDLTCSVVSVRFN